MSPIVPDETDVYPQRPAYFAHRYCRLLTKTCAANDIGPTAFVLCVTIAMVEDSKRYTAPVTFWNDQIIPLIGVKKWEALNNARSRAAAAGWLHYEAGGRHQVAKYWVTIPDRYANIGTEMNDETPQAYYPVGGYLGETSYPAKGELGGDLGGELAGDLQGELGGDPSYLSLEPIPTPKRESAVADTPAGLLELIDGWNSLPPGIVKPGNGARRDPVAKETIKGWNRAQKEPEQRELLADIPAVLEAIKRAKHCHGEGWFDVPWLFGKNKNKQFTIVKLLNGAYDNVNGNGKSKHPDRAGPGKRHESEAQRENL